MEAIADQLRSKGARRVFWLKVIRCLRDSGWSVYPVNKEYIAAEEYWGDNDYMHKNRHRHLPKGNSPGIAIVASDLDIHVTSASIEKQAVVQAGVGKSLHFKADDANKLEYLELEALEAIANDTFEAVRLHKILQDNKVYQARLAYLGIELIVKSL
jgi:hypothetical protein